jgi:multiple sugar transport system ATP-binding protein
MNIVEGDEAQKYKAKAIGIRPEHLAVSKTDGAWRGTIGVAEHLGSDTFVHVHVDQIGQLTARTDGELPLKYNEPIFLTPDATKIHRFDSGGFALK